MIKPKIVETEFCIIPESVLDVLWTKITENTSGPFLLLDSNEYNDSSKLTGWYERPISDIRIITEINDLVKAIKKGLDAYGAYYSIISGIDSKVTSELITELTITLNQVDRNGEEEEDTNFDFYLYKLRRAAEESDGN